MATYTIDSKTSRLVVTAHSSVHDSETTWGGIVGTVNATPGMMADTQASITVDMRTADAGDWLKNRKLRKDMDFEAYPSASFKLTGISELVEVGSHVRARVQGDLSWRGKTITIGAVGEGTITSTELVASGTFDLDVTQLGITPPKLLMIKIEDVVSCRIELRATR
jgi:polyisoprenoid-binding protein YceI